jgi:hypothetical protein
MTISGSTIIWCHCHWVDEDAPHLHPDDGGRQHHQRDDEGAGQGSHGRVDLEAGGAPVGHERQHPEDEDVQHGEAQAGHADDVAEVDEEQPAGPVQRGLPVPLVDALADEVHRDGGAEEGDHQRAQRQPAHPPQEDGEHHRQQRGHRGEHDEPQRGQHQQGQQRQEDGGA